MDPLRKLLAIEEIKNLKARYYRLMDQKKWDELALVFTRDATIDVRENWTVEPDPVEPGPDTMGYLIGHARIMQEFHTVGATMKSMHHGHMPEIKIESETEASGIWAMEDIVQWPDGGGYANKLHGYGWYYDQYRVEDDVWRIYRSRLVRVRVDTE